jgi:hypothetical protein
MLSAGIQQESRNIHCLARRASRTLAVHMGSGSSRPPRPRVLGPDNRAEHSDGMGQRMSVFLRTCRRLDRKDLASGKVHEKQVQKKDPGNHCLLVHLHGNRAGRMARGTARESHLIRYRLPEKFPYHRPECIIRTGVTNQYRVSCHEQAGSSHPLRRHGQHDPSL